MNPKETSFLNNWFPGLKSVRWIALPAGDFTPRLIPYFPGVAVPLEISLILWHH